MPEAIEVLCDPSGAAQRPTAVSIRVFLASDFSLGLERESFSSLYPIWALVRRLARDQSTYPHSRDPQRDFPNLSLGAGAAGRAFGVSRGWMPDESELRITDSFALPLNPLCLPRLPRNRFVLWRVSSRGLCQKERERDESWGFPAGTPSSSGCRRRRLLFAKEKGASFFAAALGRKKLFQTKGSRVASTSALGAGCWDSARGRRFPR